MRARAGGSLGECGNRVALAVLVAEVGLPPIPLDAAEEEEEAEAAAFALLPGPVFGPALGTGLTGAYPSKRRE